MRRSKIFTNPLDFKLSLTRLPLKETGEAADKLIARWEQSPLPEESLTTTTLSAR